ncbi:hypothetical protein B0A49_08886 [Cryomyces minteri]|uniref:Uncharacterized protein n=1 Tax=Cryomyces minteri TaxID=331657 RepID=A0A4V5NDE3_9PEZI|nr:hypothetical protein B0A49_08886 [Cryomyces minteri]
MAHQIHRPLVSASARFRSRLHWLHCQRNFSSTPSPRAIGPESPKYIDIPQPPQQFYPPRPRIKGILPLPRNVFRGIDKASPEYLAAVTPEPRTPRDPALAAGESRIAWKQRMAASRRKNLREGIVELTVRKEQTDKFLAQRGARRQAERQALIERKEREDEELTNPSITRVMKMLHKGVLPDPGRAERLEDMRAKVAQKEQGKVEDRQDALHTLYMQARDFITNEAQLNEAVERVFGTAEAPVTFGTQYGGGESIWNTGKPDTVQDMLNKANKTGGSSMEQNEGYTSLTQKRVKRIAEQLTGGKI